MEARLPQGRQTPASSARPPQTPILHTQTLLPSPNATRTANEPQNRSQRLHFLYFTPSHARPHDHCPPAPNRRYPVI